MQLDRRDGAYLAIGILAAVVTAFFVDRHAERLAGKVRAAEAVTALSSKALTSALARADSLERRTRVLVARAAAAEAPHLATIVRTDTARARLETEREAALRAAHDTATSRDSLVRVIEQETRDAAAFQCTVELERAAAGRRILAQSEAINGKDSAGVHTPGLVETLAAKNDALEKAEQHVKNLVAEVQVLKDAQPGIFTRAVRGLEVTGSASACAGIGWALGGPLGALAGAGVCGVMAGAFVP